MTSIRKDVPNAPPNLNKVLPLKRQQSKLRRSRIVEPAVLVKISRQTLREGSQFLDALLAIKKRWSARDHQEQARETS